MIITKSKYTNYITCPRYFYLLDNKPEEEKINEFNLILAQEGIEVGCVGRSYLGDYILVSGKDKVKETQEYIRQGHKVIAEASFSYKDLYCAIDLLYIKEDGVEIYEIKSTSHVEDIHVHDISFQTYVLNKLGYNVLNSYILYINGNYILDKTLNLKDLFKIKKIDVLNDVEDNLNKMRFNANKLLQLEQCCNPNCKECSYFGYCYSHLPKNNIFKLSGVKNAYKMFKEGTVTFEDYLNNYGHVSGIIHEKAIEQIDFELNDLPQKVDKLKLNKFLDKLVYPLYYLDFETIRKPIPKFDGYKSNMRMLIQYSLHIQLSIGSPLIHKEYLLVDDIDNRDEVALRLINDLGTEGSIIAYHSSYESGVIDELKNIVPHYDTELSKIQERIVDLEEPFANRGVYNKKMVGRSSIKVVLPAMCPNYEDAYHNLALVHNGLDAMTFFNKMLVSEGEEKQKIINGLLDYCCLDTMAMVVILEELYKLR